MRLTAVVTIGCMLVTAAGCAREENALPPELAANLAAPYDYYLNGMHSSRFDSSGSLLYTMRSDRTTHFPADGHAELVDPILQWSRKSGSPWTLAANIGNLQQTSNGEVLILSDSVKVSADLPHSGPVELLTSTLDLLPQLKLARTDAGVQLNTPSLQLQGIGLQLDLGDTTIDLRNDVRGSYAP